MFLLYRYFCTFLTFLSQKGYCRQLFNTPFPQYAKMQAIMEKSVAKGQFAHKGTVRAPPDPSIDGDDEKGDDSAIGHAVALSLATMISPASQVHDGSTPWILMIQLFYQHHRILCRHQTNYFKQPHLLSPFYQSLQ